MGPKAAWGTVMKLIPFVLLLLLLLFTCEIPYFVFIYYSSLQCRGEQNYVNGFIRIQPIG